MHCSHAHADRSSGAQHKTSPTRNSLEEALEDLLPAPYSVVVLVPNPAGSDVDSYSTADKGVCTTSKSALLQRGGRCSRGAEKSCPSQSSLVTLPSLIRSH